MNKTRFAWLAVFSIVIFLMGLTGCNMPRKAADAGTNATSGLNPGGADFREIVNRAKDKVFPAVVYIRCLREEMSSGKLVQQQVTGSGAVITPDGQVITNWHVIDKAVKVRCLLSDGTPMEAEILGSDQDCDLALLQLKVPEGTGPLPYARIGDSSKLTEGDFVMAMGAPYGLSRSVTIGIISCTNRYLEGNSEYSLWIQADAAINPGNSGGPLVDTDGVLIGINTRGGGNDLGFAIPTDTINKVITQIRKNGKIIRAWTGLQLQPLKDFNRDQYFDFTDGVIVAAADPRSPAESAGIQAGDRIVKINGNPVTALNEENLPAVRSLVSELAIGTPATFEIMRKGEPVTLQITPREKGKVEGDELDCPRWDFTVKTINQFDNEDLYFYRQKGVFVLSVKRPGNAIRSGLSPQDIILSIDGTEVRTLDDVKAIRERAIKNIDEKYRMLFVVMRNGLTRQVVLNFQRDWEKQ